MRYRKKYIIIGLIILMITVIISMVVYLNINNKKKDSNDTHKHEQNLSNKHKHKSNQGVHKNGHSSKKEIHERAESYIDGDMEIGNITSSFRTGFIDPKTSKTIFIIQENGIESGSDESEKNIKYYLHVDEEKYKLKKAFQGHTFSAYETNIKESTNELPPSINVSGKSSEGKGKVSFSSGDLGEQNLQNLNDNYLKKVYKIGNDYARNKDKVRYIDDIIIKDIKENIEHLRGAIKSSENEKDNIEMKKTIKELKKDVKKSELSKEKYNKKAKEEYKKYSKEVQSIEYFEPFIQDELHLSL